MRVAAVVLNYRRWPDVATTLQRLAESTRPPDAVVLVDNASGAAQVEAVRADLASGTQPGVELLALPDNGGYGVGMNAGAAHAFASGADAVLLLTHDVLVEPDCLELMLAELAEPGVGIVAPVLGWRGREDVAWSTGGVVSAVTGICTNAGQGGPLAVSLALPSHDVAWADGAVLLVTREVFERVGGFCPDFFLYFEEVDFAWSVRESGFRVRIAAGALAWQAPGSTPAYLNVRNSLLLLRRHQRRSVPVNLAVHCAVALKVLLLVLSRRGGSLERIRLMAAGAVDGLRGRMRPDLIR